VRRDVRRATLQDPNISFLPVCRAGPGRRLSCRGEPATARQTRSAWLARVQAALLPAGAGL